MITRIRFKRWVLEAEADRRFGCGWWEGAQEIMLFLQGHPFTYRGIKAEVLNV